MHVLGSSRRLTSCSTKPPRPQPTARGAAARPRDGRLGGVPAPARQPPSPAVRGAAALGQRGCGVPSARLDLRAARARLGGRKRSRDKGAASRGRDIDRYDADARPSAVQTPGRVPWDAGVARSLPARARLGLAPGAVDLDATVSGGSSAWEPGKGARSRHGRGWLRALKPRRGLVWPGLRITQGNV